MERPDRSVESGAGQRPVGTYSYFGYSLPFTQRLDVVQRAGFKITSVGLGAEEELVRAGDADLMPALARDRGLAVEYVHAVEGRCNLLWSAHEADRNDGAADLRTAVTFSRKHSIPIVVAHVSMSKGDQPPPPNEYGLRILKDVLREAEDSGVRIAVENTQSPAHLDYLFSRMASPCLGLCYDSSHDFLYSGDPGRLLEKWGHLLFATHFSDNDGLADRHWPPGDGIIDWAALRRVFPCAGYRGVINLEIFPKGSGEEPPLAFMKRACERARWLEETLREPKPDRR